MQAYEKYKIIPDVIDTPPGEELSVEWKRTKVKCYPGDKLTPTQVHTQPVLDWRARQDHFYTILFVHIGPVGEPVEEELHWLVFNVPAENMMRGQVHAEYLESGPTKGTGIHRYVYLVYQQPNPTKRITPKSPYQPRHLEGRKPWNTRAFAKEYELGEPVAGTFYRAEFDDSVPTFRTEVTGTTGHFLDND